MPITQTTDETNRSMLKKQAKHHARDKKKTTVQWKSRFEKFGECNISPSRVILLNSLGFFSIPNKQLINKKKLGKCSLHFDAK